jgi:hypothetical protein
LCKKGVSKNKEVFSDAELEPTNHRSQLSGIDFQEHIISCSEPLTTLGPSQKFTKGDGDGTMYKVHGFLTRVLGRPGP